MKTYLIFIVLSVILSCNGQKKLVQNTDSKAEVSDSVIELIVNDIRKLSFNILEKNIDLNENFIFCPVGTYYNLLPVYFGSNTKSKTELTQIFSINSDHEQYYGTKSKLFKEFLSKDYNFNVFNAIWLDNKYTFLENYKDFIKNELQYDLINMDFSDKELLASEINNSVAEETENQIKDILSADELQNTRMIIANALYYKSSWNQQFDKNLSREDNFYVSGKHLSKVIFMNKTSEFNYYENEFYQVVELKYSDNEVSFIAVLPKEEVQFMKAVKVLNEDYENTLSGLNSKKINLAVPRLSLAYKLDLKTSLEKMNVKEIFSDQADLSGITGNKELFIDKILQAVTFVLNEEGSEASAANVTVVKEKGASIVTNMKLNRPFIYFVKNNMNDVILFSGIIFDPAQN